MANFKATAEVVLVIAVKVRAPIESDTVPTGDRLSGMADQAAKRELAQLIQGGGDDGRGVDFDLVNWKGTESIGVLF